MVIPEHLTEPRGVRNSSRRRRASVERRSVPAARRRAKTIPDLKSNQNFLALQSQLEGTENRIAVARRDYIEAVQSSSTPSSRDHPRPLVECARWYGAEAMANFTVAEEVTRAPQVNFN